MDLELATEGLKCGAKTKAGAPCQRKGLANGRCGWHGELSTGVKSAARQASPERITEMNKTPEARERRWFRCSHRHQHQKGNSQDYGNSRAKIPASVQA